jgi:hypothetical protein
MGGGGPSSDGSEGIRSCVAVEGFGVGLGVGVAAAVVVAARLGLVGVRVVPGCRCVVVGFC